MVVLSCIGHGESGRLRTQRVIQDMLNQGTVIGKFWQVTKVEEQAFTVKRYHRELPICRIGVGMVQLGDRTSFLVQRKPGEKEWAPKRVHFHGMATLKYILSGFAVIGVIISCVLHIGLDKKNVALKLDRGRRPCRTG